MPETSERSTAGAIGDQFAQAGDQIAKAGQRLMRSDAAKGVQHRIEAHGPDMIEHVKALAGEALVRRISIQHDGKTLVQFPLAVGLGAALLAPQLAALVAMAALVSNCTITVERERSETG
jgi:hypothetical protein